MILTIMLMGALLTYLAVGLGAGRVYFMLHLQGFHNKWAGKLPTKNELEQKAKLRKLERAKEEEEQTFRRNENRRILEEEVPRAGRAVKKHKDELNKARGLLNINSISRERAEELKAEIVKAQKEYDKALTQQRMADETWQANERKISRYISSCQGYRYSEDYESRYAGRETTYEDELNKFHKEIRFMVKTTVFLWPVVAFILLGKAGYRGSQNLLDKTLNPKSVEKYTSSKEKLYAAKIQALTEKDPELSKLYNDLVKQLEA